ncbi:MAG: toprim domain-containing protein [Verrucomicrobiota bacterium]
MPKSAFVDFKAVKAAITMEQVLRHYDLFDQFTRSGDSLSGPCPMHQGANPTQFRVSLSKNIWNCFGKCKRGGNVLDFIARMDNESIHAAAFKAIEWFNLDREALTARPSEGEPGEPAKSTPAKSKEPSPVQEKNTPNPPLKFRLDKLQRNHPYLAERGLAPETIAEFGLGFCEKGMMAGRIAIPIHNPEGQVVAYAGRFPGEPGEDIPKYKLPPGFRKSLELFNIDRASKESPEVPLIIVEGFFDCLTLWQAGVKKVVALMGSTLSPAQEELIRSHTTAESRIIVMLDEDEAGRAGREDIAIRLSRFAFVHVYTFAEEGSQPEHLSPEELQQLPGTPVQG